jgi:adenosylhomocysteine nucleosidase
MTEVILVALRDEFPDSDVGGRRVIYSGVGKVHAAIAAATVLAEGATRIINFGSAGAVTPGLSGLITVGAAVERDMDLRPLGLALGESVGDEMCARLPIVLRWASGPIVGTGDSFAAEAPELPCDLVDMEAYAIAKACAQAGAEFSCLKYVSDAADVDAPDAWARNKAKGAALFADWLAMERP